MNDDFIKVDCPTCHGLLVVEIPDAECDWCDGCGDYCVECGEASDNCECEDSTLEDCTNCHGHGRLDPEEEDCPTCNGEGFVRG